MPEATSGDRIVLPKPSLRSERSLEELLAARRSIRHFAPGALSDVQLSQLLWAAQGIVTPQGLRTTPSAGALYPLEVYVLLAEGLYHYRPDRHELRRRQAGDARRALCRAALSQDAVMLAPAVFVFTAVERRMVSQYGSARTPRYIHMEAGHAAQNLLLQATALGLGGVPIGAFHDRQVRDVLQLPAGEDPLYLIPVGALP